METKLMVLLALVASAIAGPITIQESDKCSTECKDSTKFKYAPGTTYTYDYRVDTATSMAGASQDTARLTLQTTADFQVLSPCEFLLRLRNTRLFHSDGNGAVKAADREDQFRRGLESSELRFSYQDGVVDNVCADQREDTWALNIKKGILSTLQNGMDDLERSQNVTETDVAGTCKAEYKVTSDGYYTISVKKTKDILSCTDRNAYKTMLQMVSYKLPSDMQSMPLMKTTHECDQEIENGGVLKSTTCTESHLYRPFSNGQSGGMTTVKQTLTYQTARRGVNTRLSTIRSRDSLAFDHSATQPNSRRARLTVEQKLREICASTKYDIRPESPRLFSDLVTSMRTVDKENMQDLQRLLKTKTMCPDNNKAFKFFLDALPMTSTGASVSLMTSLITSGDIKGIEAKAWIASLAFVQNPTSEMLLEVKALIDNEKVREDAILPVSSLVNNYCRKTKECGQDYSVLSIIASLERNIGYSCDASGNDFQTVLLTLRAIGNAGHATRAVAVISKCLTNTNNPLEIRVAAAEAFRRMPCESESSDLWSIYEDGDLDSELRIAAYIALMRCPDDKTLGKMAASLINEEDDQVGAFVYSHLTNLRETSDPHKQEVARAINNLALDKEFDLSPLKFSRNYEASVLINKINTGFVAESNLVWSNTAQLPRSISGNLTVDLFGHAINIMDFGGRLEGMEYLIKNLFGPYMPSEDNDEQKKSVSADDVQGSLFGRIFGNELLFVHSKGYKSPLSNLPSSWLDMLIKLAKNNNFALTQSAQFMDVSLVIPTSAGLPINIDVNGTATIDLVLSGKADLRKLGSSPRSLDIDGEIRPSAAMEITGSMSVDAFVTKTGLRLRNTMHTSTALKGRVLLERGQQLNVELDTPQEKMEIFDASSKFFIVHNDMEQEQAMLTNNRKQFELCSDNPMATVTGMEVCGSISFPNASLESSGPYFPLTGPVSASIVMYKRDAHTGYKLFAKRVENKVSSTAQVSFNTPGSRVNRAILMDLTLNYPKKSLDATLATPWKKAAFNGALINSKGMKSVSGSFVVDETETYALTSEVKISQSRSKLQLNPMVEIRRPGMDNVQMAGFIALEKPMKAFNMDLSFSGINKMPYTVKASVSNDKKGRSVRASYSDDGKTEYSVLASSQTNVMGRKSLIMTSKNFLKVNTPARQVLAVDASADYREGKSLKMDSSVAIHRVLKKPATIKVALLKNEKKRGTRYDIDLNLKSTAASGRLDSFLFVKKSGLLSTKTMLDYTIPRVAKNKVILSGKFNDRSTKAYNKYTMKSALDVKKNPEYNMGLNFDIDHKVKHGEAEIEFRYGPNPADKSKRVYLSTILNKKIPNYKNAVVSYKMKAEAPAHKVDISLSGKHKHSPKLLDSEVKLSYGKGQDVSAAVFLVDKSAKMKNINGKVNVAWPGSAYTLNSQLVQNSAKQYSHIINLKGNKGMKHTISTVYKKPQAKTHEFVTNLAFDGMKPIKLSGSTTLDPKTFEAAGEIKRGKDAYGMSTKTKVSKAPSAKTVVELYYPDRKIVMQVDGGKYKNQYEGHVEAAWDAGRDKSKKLSLDGSCHYKSNKKMTSLGGNVGFTSPFEYFEDLGASFKYGSDAAQHDMNSKLSWGGKKNQITTSMNIKNPISPRNLKMTFEADTPFNGFRTISGEVSHKLDKTLNAIVKGRLGKQNAKLAITGEDLSDSYTSNLKGSVALKSTIKHAKDVTLTMGHSHSSGRLSNNAAMTLNGETYSYDFNTDHSGYGWHLTNNGDLKIVTPKQKINSNWQHRITDGSIKSTLTSDSNEGRLFVDLTGSHDLSSVRSINGVLKVQSPWKQVRDMVISVSHKNGYGLINSNAVWTQNGRTKASSNIKYTRGNDNAVFDFALVCPYTEDISGKLSTKYGSGPMTTVAELQWAPRQKVTVEGSANLLSWDNADIDVKTTTPFRGMSNVVFKATNKREGDELVSHTNFDYGVRKSVALESRFACNDLKHLARMKLTTPFDGLQSLDTGYRFDGQRYNFDGSADFEMLPIVGKIQGSANWQYNGDLRGKLRLDTPFPEYPYFQLSATSQDKGNARQSRIEAKHYPRQIYSFDTTYAFDIPIAFEATVNSPFPEYNNLGVSFQYNTSPVFVQTHGEVRYRPDEKIEGDMNADWSSNIEGSVVVKTPFQNYENNKIAVRHQGDMDAFSSHSEIDIARQSIVADASFNSGYTTTGTFTFTSPIPGLENIAFNMKKKGYDNNMKGGATLTINAEKIDADFSHRLSSNALKSAFKLTSSYTDDLKLSLEHNGLPTSFTNKMSASYGRGYDIDTVATFDYREPDVSGSGMIKYKLGNGRDTSRVSFSKTGSIDDMTFSGTASHNRDDITINGSWKSLGGLDGSVQMKTPFKGFRNIGMTMSHVGDISDFRSSASINYMDNKNINGKIEMNADGLHRIRFSSEMSTPFPEFPSVSVTFNNDYDEYRKSLNGNAALTTPVGGFGVGSITYNKIGGLDNLALDTSVNMNGRQVTILKVTNTLLSEELHSKIDFKTASYPKVVLTIDHMGDLSNFNSKAFAAIGRDSISSEMTKRGSLDDLTFSGNARYNRDTVSVNGSWKMLGGLDGSIDIKTPFDNFRNIGMTLSHTGDISDFSSSANINFMDDKNINGKVELSADGIRRIKFSSTVNTPFTSFESTKLSFDNHYNEYSMELNGNGEITTTINRFGTASMKYSKTGSLDNLVVEGNLLKNGQELSNLKITNNFQDNEMHSMFNYRCINRAEVMLVLDHSGDSDSFSTKARGMVGKNVVSGEANLSQRGSVINADGKVIYNIQAVGSNQGEITLHKEGQMDDFQVKVTGKYGNKESSVSGAFKFGDEIIGNLAISTPIVGYKNVGMSFKHSGSLERFNCEGTMNLADGEKYSGKLDFYRYLYRRIETTAELTTPISGYEYTKFEYRHEGDSENFKCYSTVEYGYSQKITYDMTASMLPNPVFSVTIKTPFDNYNEMMASASVEATWAKYSISSKVNAGNGRIVTLNGAFDASHDITGSLALSTPLDDFTDVGVTFQHSGNLAKFNCEGKVTYMDSQDVSGKIGFRLRNPKLAVEVRTPFSGYEFTKYDYRQSTSNRESVTSTSLIYGDGKIISTNTVITFMPKPSFSITIKTPYYNYEDMMAMASFENTWPRYVLTSKLNAGNGNIYSLDGLFDASSDVSGSVTIGTPIDGFTNTGVSFSGSGNDQKFTCEGKVTYMDRQNISGKISFYRYMWRRVVASAELSTPFTGMENTKAEVNYEDKSNSISATAALEYADNQKMSGNMKLTYSPNYDVLITLKTPFYDYRLISAQGTVDMTAPSYGMSYSVNYGYNNAYSANGKLNLYSPSSVDGSLEVTIPVSGFEYTKVEYKHQADSSRVGGSTSLTYGNNQVISADLKSVIYPNFDGSLTVKTPFYGYENMRGSATFSSGYNQYDASSALDMGRGYAFSMNSGLDYSVDPLRAFTKISTPYDDFRNMELTVTHEGSLANFQCTGFFSSPVTDQVNAKAIFKYESLSDMIASASLQTTMTGMDDLKVELKNSDLAGEKKTHAVVGWTDGQEIVLDGLLRQEQGWYENKVHTDVSLSTPFVAVRNLAIRLGHSNKQDSYSENIDFELNGDKLLDVDGEYNFQNKHDASLTFRKPWAMQYTATGSSENGLFNADVLANWNRDNTDSNIRLLASVSDTSDEYQTNKALDIGFEHASRKVGMVHTLTSSAQKTSSTGKLYWDSDDDSKICYEMEINDNSRRRRDMYDGNLKFGLPSQTLTLSGSYSDNTVVKTTDATFSWDADRDSTKQVGVKATMTRGDRIKGDVTLSIPYIRKEIRVDGEVMMQNGRVILDTKTDISYSPDTRKTLTLTSKLEDITDYYSNYNYSLELGVSHPYTNVDVRMSSHLGSSNDRMTMGIKTDYLTARRQNRNMALLAEIDTLKKKINLQLFNPVNKVELTGDVVSTSPYKIRMLNKIDDVEAFRSDLTLDSDKKSMVFNAYMDSDRLTVAALYPNSSAFRADVTRITPEYKENEALLRVRLNTSRLLHTRIHWRPHMMEELRQFVLDHAMERGVRATEFMTTVNDAVAEELAYKYTAITSAFSEEVEPLIKVLNREMTMVAHQMHELSRDLRVMYENNDFYIQDMGTGATEYYMTLQETLQQISREYRQAYSEIIQSMNENLDALTRYPIREQYSELVNEGLTWFNENLQSSLTSLEECLAKVDTALQEYRDSMQKYKKQVVDTVYNATYVDYVANKLGQIKNIDVSPYVPSMEIPEEYTNAIYNIHNSINSRVSGMLDFPEVRYLKGGVNEVYQQGVWAYKYWQLEENIYKHGENILEIIKEIVEDELKEYVQNIRALYKNPITVWDPEHGEVQTELALPFDWKRLDEVPDVSPLINKAQQFADLYMPDQSTWNNFVDSMPELWSSESDVVSNEIDIDEDGDNDDDEVTKVLEIYKPSRKYRKLKKGRRYRVKASRK